jgi:hypothetical protein
VAARGGRLVQDQIVADRSTDRDARGVEFVDLRCSRSQSDQPQFKRLARRIILGQAGEFPRAEALARRSAILSVKASLDRFTNVPWHLVESFARVAQPGIGNFGPETALSCVMDKHF